MGLNLTNLAIILTILIIVAYYLTTNSHPRTKLTDSQVKEIVSRQHHNATDIRKKHKRLIQKQQERLRIAGHQVSKLLELGDLYTNGIPDKYDMYGRKLTGVPPFPDRAIDAFTAAANMGSIQALFKLAKIYHYGLGEMDPDITTANNYYNQVLSSSNYTLRLLAQEKLDEIETEQRPATSVTSWFKYSTSKFMNGISRLNDPLSKFLDPLGGSKVDITTIFRVPPNTNNQITINAQAPAQQGGQAADNTTGIANDMHNVHDHSVIATIKKSYENLAKDTKITTPKNKCCRELRNFVGGFLKNDKKTDALIALDAVERSFLPHTGIDATESDVLALVWNRMNGKFASDAEAQQTIKENLANGLCEMIEHGKVCCVTGRLSRILDSLNIIDEAVQIKPTFAINQEMMDKAAKISQDMIDNAPDDVKNDYNNAKDTSAVTALTNDIRKKIRTELSRDYVDSGILTKEGFDAQINKWIDSI